MAVESNNESMLDMYIFEETQLIEQLEKLIMESEEERSFSSAIDEIFRIMHTIKGSSSMMFFTNIANLSHAVEDLFYFFREKKPEIIDYNAVSDIVLNSIDFIKNEIEKIQRGESPDGEASEIISEIKTLLNKYKESTEKAETDTQSIKSNQTDKSIVDGSKSIELNLGKQLYEANVFFCDGCEMENIRAFAILHKLSEVADIIYTQPEDVMGDNSSIVENIRNNGFKLVFYSELNIDDIRKIFNESAFVEKYEVNETNSCKLKTDKISKNGKTDNVDKQHEEKKKDQASEDNGNSHIHHNQGMISVNIFKTDKLMDLIGELVISEAMVTQNIDLRDLELENFQKSASQHRKIISELQDIVMSIRMISLYPTFQKMHRLVRDMSKKMNKSISLIVVGEETEVDKSIIEHISDPLMHLVRNAIDHGIESTEERLERGKKSEAAVTLEARNSGSDILVTVKDDGRGINKEKVLKKAIENSLIEQTHQNMTDEEIYKLILLPGFSTKDAVSEYSGRGVGMDVVLKNIEAIGGSVSISSEEGIGTSITLKIPLTLTIIDGMNISVGNYVYTIPIMSIIRSFKASEYDVLKDPEGNEMVMVRGECYPILRIHEYYLVETEVKDINNGILIMVEKEGKCVCIFADELLGKQQIVVKPLPQYIKKTRKIDGISGCSLMGDGGISLILDIGEISHSEKLLNMKR